MARLHRELVESLVLSLTFETRILNRCRHLAKVSAGYLLVVPSSDAPEQRQVRQVY